MVLSMTAFARNESPSLVWEVRSVNHRFLEISLRMPESLRELEYSLRDRVREKVSRGKLDANLRIAKREDTSSLNLNRANLQALLKTLEQIRHEMPEIGYPDPLDLLRWPGVVSQIANDQTAALKAEAIASFEQTMNLLIEHRCAEGGKLTSLLQAKLDEVEAIVAELKTTMSSLTTILRGKLKERIDQLIKNIDATRMEQEVAILAQKADVAEELDRLVIHTQECRKSLVAEGPQGRRLDFLMQELNREANTLASKSIDAHCSKRAVDLKVIIEQMREQVQNVE
jgi:uncharacterized protein (TIGR00255 family)